MAGTSDLAVCPGRGTRFCDRPAISEKCVSWIKPHPPWPDSFPTRVAFESSQPQVTPLFLCIDLSVFL